MTGTPVGGRRTVLEAVRSGRAHEVLLAHGARSTPGLRELVAACRDAGVELRQADRSELDSMAHDHQGVIATIDLPRPIGERELGSWPFADDALVVVLDGITDPHNLGAAARSAEAAGAAMLVTRTRRAADLSAAAVRTSAGAILHLTHARVANIARALERLQHAGFTVIGLDQDAERSVYEMEPPTGRVGVVVGSEDEGLGRLTRDACDVLVRLPMLGQVGSLNASASLAAVLYAFVLPSRSR